MIGAGLEDRDLLGIDRLLNLENWRIAICLINGDFTVKRIKKENELIIWGVVECVIKKV